VLNTATGCYSDVFSFTIQIKQAPQLAGSATNPTCAGVSNGSIDVTLTGGSDAMAYVWTKDGSPFKTGTTSNASADADLDLTNLGPGSYELTVTANGCTTQPLSLSVVAPPAVAIDSVIPSDVSCYGQATGSLDVYASGGNGSLLFSKDGGTTYVTGTSPFTFTGLTAGNYVIRVKDTNGCESATQPVTLSQPAQLVLTPTVTAVSCNGGSDGTISLVASGGGDIYQYQLGTGPWQDSNVFAGLSAGTYSVTVQDNNDCTLTATNIVVGEPPVLTLSASQTTPVTCYGESNGVATATVNGGNGGYSYTIAGPTVNTSGASSGVFSGLTAGEYTVTVKDSKNCTLTSQAFTITQPDALTASALQTTAVTCNGGSDGVATATVGGGNGGYSYTIAGPTVNTTGASSGVFSGLSAGEYTVTVKDGKNCTTTATVTITQPDVLSLSAVQTTAVSCHGESDGTASVSASGGNGGYSYTLGATTNTTGIFNGLAAGEYTVTVKDAKNCTTTTTVTITQPAALSASAVQTTAVTCNGGSDGVATATVGGGNGGYSYTIAGPTVNTTGASSGVFSGLSAGEYTVTVKDGKNCTTTATVTITQPDVLSLSAVQTTAVSCHGESDGTASVSASGGNGGYSYTLGATTNTTGIFNGLAAGEYTITVKDSKNCTLTSQSFTITQPDALTIAASVTSNYNGSQLTCATATDGTITATASGGNGGYSYTIAGPTVNTTGASSGVFTGLSAGTYTVTVNDSKNCSKTSTEVILTAPPALTLGSAAVTSNYNGSQLSCATATDGKITVVATGGTGALSYSLTGGTLTGSVNNATGVFTGLGAGSYQYAVTDENGCAPLTGTITITAPPVLTGSITAQTAVDCKGNATGSVTVAGGGGTPGYTYSIDGTTFGGSGTFADLAAGPYTVTVKDANGCTTTVPVTIVEPALALSLSAVQTTAVSCHGGSDGTASVSASGGNGGYAYTIAGPTVNTTGASSGVFTGLTAGEYTITVNDSKNCTLTSQSFTITQPDALTASAVQTAPVSCKGGSDGAASVSASGGNGGYSYTLGATTNTTGIFNGLAAGEYTVTVKDSKNCSTTATLSISEPTALTATASQTTAVSCYGGTDGTASVSASGGNGGYTYTLGATTNTTGIFNGLAAGEYTVTVKDAKNCTTTTTVTITQPDALTASALQTTAVTCYGGSDGVATATVGGGNGGYSYTIAGPTVNTTGASSGVFSGLSAGEYTITVKDSKNCTTTATVTITQPAQVQATSFTASATEVCAGMTVNLQVAITAGVAPFTVVYTNGTTNVTVNNYVSGANIALTPAAGSYAYSLVSVTDATGCVATLPNTTLSLLVNPQTVAGTLSGAATVCATGNSGTLTLTGNVGNVVRWEINDGSGWVAVGTTSTTFAYSDLVTTTQFRAVVKSGSCAEATSNAVTITVTPETVAGTIASPATICQGSTGSLSLSGYTGTAVQWQQFDGTNWVNVGSQQALPAGATFTTPTLTTSTQFRAVVYNGVCDPKTSGAVTVPVDPQPVGGTAGASLSTVCVGSSVTLSVSGQTGSVQRWESSPNGTSGWTTVTNPTPALTATTWFRAVVKNGVCTQEAYSSVVKVTVDPASVGGTVTGPASICQGSTANLALTGNVGTIQWQQLVGSTWTNLAGQTTSTLTTPTLTTNTQFRALVTSGVCSSTTSNAFTVVVDLPSNGGTVAVTSGQPTTLCNVTGGTVSGQQSTSVTVTGYTGNIVRWESATSLSGPWTTIALTASTISVQNLTTTTYYRAVVKNGNCAEAASTTPVAVTVSQPASITLQPASATVCPGTAVSFFVSTSPSSGVGYSWQSRSSAAGTYATISGATSNNYAIAAGNVTTALNGSQYRVLVTNGACTTTSGDATLTVNTPTSISSQPSSVTQCPGGQAQFTVTAAGTGLSYQWQKQVSPGNYTNVSNSAGKITGATSNSLIVSNLATADGGTYRVVVTGSCGTVTSSDVTLTVVPPVTISTQPVTRTVSPGSTVSFSVTASGGTLSYRWQKNSVNLSDGGRISGATTATLTITNVSSLDQGSYRVVVSNQCGSTVTSSPASLNIRAVSRTEVPVVVEVIEPTPVQPIRTALATKPTRSIPAGTGLPVLTENPLPKAGALGGADHSRRSVEEEAATVFPNPSDGVSFRVRVADAAKVKVSLFNVQGRGEPITTRVLDADVVEVQPETRLTSGMYLLRVEAGRQRHTLKVLVE
jgi:hypothetical protein